MKPIELEIINALSKGENPMHSIYGICALMGNPQRSSRNKFYQLVYRHTQQLVKQGRVFEMTGVRDPSVFLSTERVK